ncbi:MAG: NAD-dependent epimerase/dehydratase family protein [Actinomycetota bacterium]|nr:NAD-dependent epimerase/dehydratase family protein [Actinomycetota bacterium]
MKALVTGATGFIGSHVAEKLIKEGFEVRALVRPESNLSNLSGLDVKLCYGDLTNRESLDDAVKGCDSLFHVAASYSFWCRDALLPYRVNVEGTRNIMEAAVDHGVEKIIYTSSESTIAIDKNQPLGTEGRLNHPQQVYSHYKRSKVLAEMEVAKLCGQGWPIVIVNPTAPIGSRDIKPTPTGKIVLDFLQGKMPAYVNTGLNIIDVEDVAAGHLLAYHKGKCGQSYILGHENMTLRQILEMVANLAGLKPPKIQIPLWVAAGAACFDQLISDKILKKHPRIPLAAVKTAAKKRFFDCSKAKQELGLKPGPVQDAFTKSINWFKEEGYVKH